MPLFPWQHLAVKGHLWSKKNNNDRDIAKVSVNRSTRVVQPYCWCCSCEQESLNKARENELYKLCTKQNVDWEDLVWLGFFEKKKNSGAWFLRTRISNFYQIRCSSKSIDSDGFSIESCRKKKTKIYGGVQRFNGSKLYLWYNHKWVKLFLEYTPFPSFLVSLCLQKWQGYHPILGFVPPKLR